MPQRQPQVIQQYIQKSLKHAQKLVQSSFYSYAARIYQQLMRLKPQSIDIATKYSTCLCELNQLNKSYMLMEQALKKNPSSLDTYHHYIKILNKYEKFEKVKLVVKNAHNVSEQFRKNTKLCTSYAQACHRSQTFRDGIEMLKQYESTYKDLTLKTESILLWRVYLCYQVGQYKQAVEYSDIILKLGNLKEDDLWYYRFQKCKYCALLGDYQTTLKLAEMIIKQSSRDKSKLKVYAIKSFCLLQNNQIKEGLAILELALKDNPNDFMLQLKWCLINLMALRKNPQLVVAFQKLKSNHIKQRLKYVIKKMDECSKADFDNNIFSQHYNWYSELIEYKENLKKLLTFLDETNNGKFIDFIIDFGELLFMSLMQGYEDCNKTNLKLSEITSRIRQICQEPTQHIEK